MGERGDRRTKSRILRRTGIAVAVLAGVFVLAVAIIVAFGITLSLEALRPNIEAAAQSALGRKVRIEGPLTLLPGLRPTIEMRSLRIANVPTSDAAVFAQIGSVRVSVQLLPLIRREIHLDEITIDNVDVRLESGADGEGNWVFAPEKPAAATDSADGSAFEFVRLSALSIRNLAIDYYEKVEKGEKGSGRRIAIAVESVEGSAGRDDPTELSAKGVARGQPFSVSVAGGSLAGLSDPGRPWPVDIQARLAELRATQ